MLGAWMITFVFFLLLSSIPAWFSPDETLQRMIGVTLPYVGVGNLALNFGCLCWYIIGAQGRYKLGAIVKFVAQWGMSIPLAAVYTFVCRFDLQGLTSAVVCGNVAVGATLSYHLLLTSKWDLRAVKIQARNLVLSGGESQKDPPEEEETAEHVCAVLLRAPFRAALATPKHCVILLTAPPGSPGVQIDSLPNRPGVVVTSVAETSSFFSRLRVGDIILCVDGVDITRYESLDDVFKILLLEHDRDRELTILTTPGKVLEEVSADYRYILTGLSPDIPDFENDVIDGFLPPRPR